MTNASPKLVAIGTALPPVSMTSQEYADFAVRMSARVPREAALINAIVRRSGIVTRHSVLALPPDGTLRLPFYEDRPSEKPRVPTTAERMEIYEREAPPLALSAARNALGKAHLQNREITHIVTASCTGFTAPGIDHRLMEELDLDPSTPRTHIGFMGCHAAINALAAARAICRAQPSAIVLGVMVELCTLHFQPGLHRDDALPNALFADAAAAFIMTGPQSPVPATPWRISQTRSRVLPDTKALMTWRITDSGFRMTLDASVPDVIAAQLPPLTREWGWADSPATAWAIHPGGPRILEAASRTLGVSEERTAASRKVLATVGNVSSATVLFILEEILRHPEGLDTIRLLAFGPGLSVEAAEFVSDGEGEGNGGPSRTRT